MKPVRLSDSAGKVRFISVVPSLYTSVCSIQTVTFNKELDSLGDRVAAYTISADLPFAQGRFCSEKNISNMETLSDHREVKFGQDYGLLLKDARLLSRAVIVVGKDDRVAYVQVVPEVTQEPDYIEAMEALKKTL